MTIDEAIDQMKEGKKVRHTFFLDFEYVYYKNGNFFNEARFQVDMNTYSEMTHFEKGWELYTPKTASC